jgi:hypothetical protein
MGFIFLLFTTKMGVQNAFATHRNYPRGVSGAVLCMENHRHPQGLVANNKPPPGYPAGIVAERMRHKKGYGRTMGFARAKIGREQIYNFHQNIDITPLIAH